MSSDNTRVFGLDVMRAVAISLVVFWHTYGLIADLMPGSEEPFYVDGVDLFFVLSGYLIGGILIKLVKDTGTTWRTRAITFWSRRFLRTLPAYYLFLLLNIGLVAAGVRNGVLNHNAPAYFVFLQNVWKPIDLFFWESWSLVVEEWFYVLFPLLLALCMAVFRIPWRSAFIGVAMFFVVASLLVRYHLLGEVSSVNESEALVRKLVITRTDTIVFGVLAALLRAEFPIAWFKLRWPLFVLGALGVFVVPTFYGDDLLTYSVTWFFTFNAIAMALLLPLLSTWRRVPPGGVVLSFISHVSYALYLVHLPLRSLLQNWYDPCTPLAGWVQIVFYWIACLGISWVVSRYWEKPFMDLRDRLLIRLGVAPRSSAS